MACRRPEEGLHRGQSHGRVLGLVLAVQRQEDVFVHPTQALDGQLLAAHCDARFQCSEFGARAGHAGADVYRALQDNAHRLGVLFSNDGDVLPWREHVLGIVLAGLDDAGLLTSNLRNGIPEVVRVVEAYRHDHGYLCVDHVGGIPRAAEADLDDGDVDGGIGKGCVRDGNKHFEGGHRNVGAGIHHLHIGLDFTPDAHEVARVDGVAVDADALGDQLQVRAGHQANTAVEGAQQRINHAGGRGLTVGASDLDDVEGTLRVTQEIHEHLDALEARLDDGLWGAGVELRGDLGQLRELFRRSLLGGGLLVILLATEVEGQAGVGDFHRPTIGALREGINDLKFLAVLLLRHYLSPSRRAVMRSTSSWATC